MRDDYDDYDSIRIQVEKRVKKHRRVNADLRGLLLLTALSWVLWIVVPRLGLDDQLLANIQSLLLMTTITLSTLGVYAIGRWFRVMVWEPRQERRDQEVVEQELERELAKRGLLEKRKNLALSEDGELVEITEDDGGLQQRGNEIYR